MQLFTYHQITQAWSWRLTPQGPSKSLTITTARDSGGHYPQVDLLFLGQWTWLRMWNREVTRLSAHACTQEVPGVSLPSGIWHNWGPHRSKSMTTGHCSSTEQWRKYSTDEGAGRIWGESIRGLFWKKFYNAWHAEYLTVPSSGFSLPAHVTVGSFIPSLHKCQSPQTDCKLPVGDSCLLHQFSPSVSQCFHLGC